MVHELVRYMKSVNMHGEKIKVINQQVLRLKTCKIKKINLANRKNKQLVGTKCLSGDHDFKI